MASYGATAACTRHILMDAFIKKAVWMFKILKNIWFNYIITLF